MLTCTNVCPWLHFNWTVFTAVPQLVNFDMKFQLASKFRPSARNSTFEYIIKYDFYRYLYIFDDRRHMIWTNIACIPHKPSFNTVGYYFY